MGVSPDYYMNKASETASFYMDLETKLLTQMRVRLNSDMTVPISDWQKARLIEVQRLRKDAIKELRKVSPQLAKNINDNLLDVYKKSFNITTSQFQKVIGKGFEFPKKGVIDFASAPTKSLENFIGRVVSGTDGISNSLIGSMEGAYKGIIQEVVAMDTLGIPRRQALQTAMNRIADKGIPIITDKAGRKWNATNYTEMLMRTEARDIDFLATKNRMDDYGWNLIQTSQHMNESDLCAPWSNKVLSLSEPDSSALSKIHTQAKVFGTWDEAVGDGYKHPNCRHTEFVYVPGLTSKDPDLASLDNRIANGKKVQQQRSMERQVRKWKNREAVATTPEIKAKAHTKVRQWQSKTKAFTDDNGLKRLYSREKNLIPTGTKSVTPLKISPKAKPVTVSKPKVSATKPTSKSVPQTNLTSKTAGDKYFRENWKKNTWNKAQLDAIDDYSRSGYTYLNKELRTGINPSKLSIGRHKSGYHLGVKKMDVGLKNAMRPNPTDIKVYRGSQKIKWLSKDGIPKKGTIFTDKGYVSSSVLRKGTGALEDFNDMRYQFKINVPKDYPVAGIKNVAFQSSEYELLLDRGTEFIVTKATNHGYKWTIELDVIPK